jgi:hypothetical protein
VDERLGVGAHPDREGEGDAPEEGHPVRSELADDLKARTSPRRRVERRRTLPAAAPTGPGSPRGNAAAAATAATTQRRRSGPEAEARLACGLAAHGSSRQCPRTRSTRTGPQRCRAVAAQPDILKRVGIDQKIGQQLPLDTRFRTRRP